MTLRYSLAAAVFACLIMGYLVWLGAHMDNATQPRPGTIGWDASCYEGECR